MRKGKFIVFVLVLIFSLTSAAFADTVKYGSKGQKVVKIQTQLKKLGYFKADVTGYFGRITKTAVKKFQTDKGLLVDGIVGPQTTKALFGNGTSSASTAAKVAKAAAPSRGGGVSAKTLAASGEKAKIEMLDWWKEAGKVFAIGDVAKVTDVRTGKTFNIMRTYGSNHADSETLALEDTKIMKEIWGGQWSWARRPVILEIDGRRLAASMAGMPHAGIDSQPANKIVNSRSQGYGRGYNLDKVKNNGMDGHFDVHFLNSRTHGTNRVDPNHQKAVKEAAASEK